MTAAAQDGTGTVWALPISNNGYDQSQDGIIYRWQAESWVKQILPEAAGFRPVALAQGDDGSVYALWQKRGPNWYPGQGQEKPAPCLITVQRGTHVRMQSQFTAALPALGPFSAPIQLFAKGGDVWIADDAPTLLHVSPDGTIRSFSLTADQVFGGKFSSVYAPVPSFNSAADPLGRRWFWQARINFWPNGALRGFLIWDGKTLAYHPTLPGLPDRPCAIIAPHGPHFLWAVQAATMYPSNPKLHGDLYRIDTQTLTATPVALPPEVRSSNTSLEIRRIFWRRGDLCVLGTDYFLHEVSLWRQRKTKWQKESDALAQSQSPSNVDSVSGPPPQPMLDTATGTWLGVSGAGLEWLSADGKKTVTVDWRRGLAAGQVSALFRLPDGRIMPFPFSGRGALLPPQPPPLLLPRPGVAVGTPGQPASLGDLLADQNRHLWGFLYQSTGQQALEEWDGRRWHAHPIPKFKSSNQTGTLYACDTLGRIWLTVSIWNPPAQAQPVDAQFVYDPARDAWTQYKAVPEAVAAAAAQPGMAFLPYRNTFYLPVFSGDGRAAYADNQSVFLYDGKQWHNWKSRDVQPGYSYGNPPEKPRFASDGHFQVTLADHSYGWTPEDGWQPNGFAPAAHPPPPLPSGGPPGWAGQPVLDIAGGGWVALNGDVYLTRGGLWRRLTVLSGRGSPFYDGRYLQSVLQDTQGRFFFETVSGSSVEYVVWSPPAVPLPAPRIEVHPLSADSVRLHFQMAAHGPGEFQWRLNGGAWKTPQPGSSERGKIETLTGLRSGTYRVEAQAISPLLQASPAPSSAVFVVQPPSAAQIVLWVRTLLSGSDSAREIAVAELVKQSAVALPALQAAHPAASESGKWWLDAAIQQITDARQISAGETPEIAN